MSVTRTMVWRYFMPWIVNPLVPEQRARAFTRTPTVL
jgi:hypothetical protein